MQHFQMDKVAYRILKKERTNIDRAMMFFGVLGPIATIPQIYTIYSSGDSSGVSIISWIFYLVIAMFGLAYSIVHRLRPLIFSNILWIFADGAVIAGCLLYSK